MASMELWVSRAQRLTELVDIDDILQLAAIELRGVDWHFHLLDKSLMHTWDLFVFDS
jgi:hypothetical protein